MANYPINAHGVTPTLPPGTALDALYWTVQPVLVPISTGTNVPGPVSSPQAFFLDSPSSILDGVGQATYGALKQRVDPLEDLTFECTGIGPQAGQVFQSLMSTAAPAIPPIQIAFSVSISLGQESLFRVWRTSLIDFQSPLPVSGTWALSTGQVLPRRWQPIPQCMVFTPAETMLPNCRYSVEVDSTLLSTNGQTLEEPIRWSFNSYYRPFHIDPYRVRQRLGEHSSSVTEEDLYWACWRASMRANRELMWYIPTVVYRGGPTEQTVSNFTAANTMAINGFVELEATIRLLEKLVGRGAEDSGISEVFKESQVSVSPERMKSIEAAIKSFRPEWETYRAEISFKRARPRGAVKSGSWRGNVDRSFRRRQGF